MYKNVLILIVLPLLIATSFYAKGQSQFDLNEISLDQDTLISKEIKDLTTSDSVQILEYRKIKYPDFPAIDERLVYIDHRTRNEFKDQMSSYFLDLHRKVEISYEPEDNKQISGNIDSLLLRRLNGVFVSLESLKGEDILFFHDVQYRFMLSGNSLYWYTMEGWTKFDIITLKKENNNICLKLNNGTIYEIRAVGNGIQIWKEYRSSEGKQETIGYSRRIKLENALLLPVFHIINTGEMDDYYDKFDLLALEQIFNN